MINGELIRGYFFFYIENEHYKDVITNKIHFEYWKRYFHIFDELTFIVSLNPNLSEDQQDVLYKEFQSFAIDQFPLIDLGFKKEINNPLYRETRSFESLIVDHMAELDGVTFWGHNKGITNLNRKDTANDSIYHWISMMYYECFEHFEEDVPRFNDMIASAYGGPKFVGCCWNKQQWMYAGSMFWGMYRKISDILSYSTNVEMPNNTGRWYTERLLGNILPRNAGLSHDCREAWSIDGSNLYEHAEDAAHFLYREKFEEYIGIHDEIMSKCIS